MQQKYSDLQYFVTEWQAQFMFKNNKLSKYK